MKKWWQKYRFVVSSLLKTSAKIMTELHSFELPGKPHCGLRPNYGFTSVPDIFFKSPPPFVTTPLKFCSFCNSGQIGSLETAIRRTAPKLCNV